MPTEGRKLKKPAKPEVVKVKQDKIKVVTAAPTPTNRILIKPARPVIIRADQDKVKIVSVPRASAIPGVRVPANVSGTALAVAVNAQVDVITLVPTRQLILRGFNGFGDGDVDFELFVNSIREGVFATNVFIKTATLLLPTSIVVTTLDTIILRAKNTGIGPSKIEGIIFLEE